MILPDSDDPAMILNLPERSNIDTDGRWFFRVDVGLAEGLSKTNAIFIIVLYVHVHSLKDKLFGTHWKLFFCYSLKRRRT